MTASMFRSLPRRLLYLWVAATLGAVAPVPVAGAEPTHLGVASCAGSVCHGSVATQGAQRVRQNEYAIWLQRDRHARAYDTLLTEASQRIAANLGIGAAHEADLCLDCHADNVAPERRGEKFQLSDGVGCESCHGGAEDWIATHTIEGTTRADNTAKGMRPIDAPATRAELCLSCHLGNEDRFVTHRVMAAGHPRTAFELETFTHLQPAHFIVDDDYHERKEAPSPAKLWAVGQTAAAVEYLRALASPTRSRSGAWPEFVLYDCFGCHHDIGGQTVRPGPAGIGTPRINRAHLTAYRVIVGHLEARERTTLDRRLHNLERAVGLASNRQRAIAAEALAAAETHLQTVASWQPDANDIRVLLGDLTSSASAHGVTTYAAAEQRTMAAQALIEGLREAGGSVRPATRQALDALFDATAEPDHFRASTFRNRLAALRRSLQANGL